MESVISAVDDIGTFIKPLQGFLTIKNYQSARSILELLVDKYGSNFNLSDWSTVIDGVVQVTVDSLAAPKPVKKVLELPSKLSALALLCLEKISEEEYASSLLIMLPLWSRVGNAYLGSAQRTGFHWLFLASCRSFTRVLALCEGEITSELQAFRGGVEEGMDQLEIAMLWYACMPRVSSALTQLCNDLRNCSATETLEAVCAVFISEPLLALRGVAAKLTPTHFIMCKALAEVLNPVLAELQSCLGTLAQKFASDSSQIVGLADRVTTIANHLIVFREFQDAVVQCYQTLSRHTSEEKVLKLLAASWQTKLDLEVNPVLLERSPHVYTWRKNREQLATLRKACVGILSDPLLEFHTRYSNGILKLANEMADDCLQSMGPAPCPFSIVATGSLSRKEMSLGSDLDLSILVRSRDIPIPFFTRLIEQLELRLQWQGLALDELTVSYISKANEFGLNNVPALVCSLHAEFSKGSTNVEPFALLWPTAVFSTTDGSKLCAEFVEGTQAFLSDDLVCQQTGFHWLKSHMSNLKQYLRGSLFDGAHGRACNIKKELLQPLTVWSLDFAVFNGILTEYSTLGCLNTLQAQGRLHPRFVEQIKQALVYLHTLRVHKQTEGAESDEFFPPEMKESPTSTSPNRSSPAFFSSSTTISSLSLSSSSFLSTSSFSLIPFSEQLNTRTSSRISASSRLTSQEWHTLQNIQRYLVRPILCATEAICSQIHDRLENAKMNGTHPRDIFATAFRQRFDPLMSFIALLAHKIFQHSSESWDTGMEEVKEVSQDERQEIQFDLAEALSYLAASSASSIRAASHLQAAIEAEKTIFMEIVPISSVRLLYCRFLVHHLQLTGFPKSDLDVLIEALSRWPTASGARKMLLDEEYAWQHSLETALTCKSNSEASGLEVLLEWAHNTEDQQGTRVCRVVRPGFENALVDPDGRLKLSASTHGEIVVKVSRATSSEQGSIGDEPDAAFIIQFDHPDPCFQLSVQSLGARITGYQAQATLAKLTVVKVGLPLDSMIPVLISHPFASGSIRGNECEPDQLEYDRRCFTLKVFETLVMRPEDESLSNLIMEPVPSTSQKASYRIHRTSHLNCFVRHTVVERREGPRKTEKLECKSFVFCLSAMQDLLSHDAMVETLLLDPKQLLDAWLTNMDAHNRAYTSAERSQTAHRGPTFKWSSEPIFTPSEIRYLDEQRAQRHHSHPIVSHAIAPNVVQGLFQRLVCLLQVLKRPEAAKYTHLNLLEEMDPLLHHYYHSNCWLLKTATNSIQRWQAIPQGFNESKSGYMGYAVREPVQFVSPAPDTPSAVRDVNPRAAKSHLKQVYCFLCDAQLARGRLVKGHLRQTEQPLMDAAYEQMINSTDFTRMSRSDGWENADVLREMFGTIKFGALRLAHCESLSGSLLSTILQCSHQTLTSLDICGCPNLGHDGNFHDILVAISTAKGIENLNMSSVDALTFVAIKSKTKGKLKPVVFGRLQQLQLNQCVHLSHVKLLAPCLENFMARDCLALQMVEVFSRVPLSVDLRGCHKLGDSVLQDLFDPPFLKSDVSLSHDVDIALAATPTRTHRSDSTEGRSKSKRNQLLWVDFSGSNGLHSLTITSELSVKTLLLNNCSQLASLSVQNDHVQALSLQDCHSLARISLACHNLYELDLGGSYFLLFPTTLSDILQGCSSLLKIRTRSSMSDIFKRAEDLDEVTARTTPHVAVLTDPLDGVRQICEEILQGTHDTVAAVLVNVGSMLAIASCFRKCQHVSTKAEIPNKIHCCKSHNVQHLVMKCPPGVDLMHQSAVVALSRMAQTVWLKSLHLEGMNLGDQGSMMVAEAFRCNHTGNLKTLRLVNIGMADQGCISVARLLQTCHLTELSLKGNKFGDKGCRALAVACHATPQLRVLDISENKSMTVDGLHAIATAVERHTDLKLTVGLWNPVLQKLGKSWGRKVKLKGLSLFVSHSLRESDLELDGRQCMLCLMMTDSKDVCTRCGSSLYVDLEIIDHVSVSKTEEGKKKESDTTPKKSLKLFFGENDTKNRQDLDTNAKRDGWTCSCGKANADANSKVCECGVTVDARAVYHLMRCLDNTVLTPAQSFVEGISQSFSKERS